jgi:IS5 family transposase
MIQRRYTQRSLFEAAVGSVEQLVAGLVAPALTRLDTVLADEQLREIVVERLAQRRPQSRPRGRPGTPAEVVLRILALQRLKGWSFAQTEQEVRSRLVYRLVTWVYFERVPDAKTLIRLSAVLGPEGVKAIHERGVELAHEERIIRGRRARVDTTVVETNVHYPTDSGLLADGVRVLPRAVQRIVRATVGGTAQVRNRRRATTRRVLAIARAARARGRAAQERITTGYWKLLAIVRTVVRESERVVAELTQGVRRVTSGAVGRRVERARACVQHFVPLVERVVAQTVARVFGGEVHYPHKLLSLFEPHTEAIRKGKAAKPTEFGKLLKVHEAENQIVVDYEVYAQGPADQTLLIPTVSTHIRLFGRPPELVAADPGFWSARNKQAALEAGVRRVCVPATGRPSAAQRAEQRQRWFRRGQRFRTGCEGRISVLKRRDGLDRCRYHGPLGMNRWIGWGVVANNLWVLMYRPAK